VLSLLSGPAWARLLASWWPVHLGLCALIGFASLAGLAQSVPDAGTSAELIAKARDAELKRDFLTAARLYQDYLAAHPDDPEILQRLGLANYLSNQFNTAIPPLTQALKLDPSRWGSALFLGISYYRTDRFTDAVEALKRALALKPDLTDAEFWLGCSLLATGQPESAIANLLRARNDPRWSVQADNILIKAYRKAAENEYQRIATVAPDSSRVHLVKAQLLAWKGIKNGVVWEAQEALKRDPKMESAHRLIAEVFWEEKGFDQAAREFQAELQINPLDAESNLRLGEIRLAKGDSAGALSFLNTALPQRFGSPGEIYHFLGEAKLAQRDYGQAAADLNRAAQENPADPTNHQLLAEVYRATGHLDLAAQEEQLSRQLSPARK
jgi:Tfp pilus assembly protein PilF